MTTDLKFPMDFDICPNCGSKRRVTEIVTNEEIEEGNLKPGSKLPLVVFNTPIFDKNSALLALYKKVPMLFAFLDVCADCGTVYCVHIEKATGTIAPQQPQQPKQGTQGIQGIPPFFGKG